MRKEMQGCVRYPRECTLACKMKVTVCFGCDNKNDRNVNVRLQDCLFYKNKNRKAIFILILSDAYFLKCKELMPLVMRLKADSEVLTVRRRLDVN